MSEATTRGVRVMVESVYLPERSSPDSGYYFFAYFVSIHNEGEIPVQLLTRHWIITDGTGHVEEVKGPGVVGQKPLLAPGKSFEYNSYCPLPTEVGSMRGSYQMVTEDGDAFDAEVAPFTLAVPHMLH